MALSVSSFAGAPGCFVTIADPAPVRGAGGGAGATSDGGGGLTSPGSGGAGAGDAGGASAGSAGAGAADGGCDGGRKVCGGACVGPNDPAFGCGPGTCTPCALSHAASGRCEGGACVVAECEPDWVDCDGKAENGCEIDFGNPLPGATTVEATRLSPVGGADPSEWSGLPRAALEDRCGACRPDQPGQQPGEPILSAAHDAKNVRAQFRVAWDDLALYVFTQVEDDEIVAWNRANPEQQDGVELFLDGMGQGTKGYGPDDHHLFVGAIGENVFEKDPSDVGASGKVTVKSRIQQACYFVEVRLTWFYVMGLVPHSPQPGNTYGFTLAVNDWDTTRNGDAGQRPERQNQLFWVQPGVEYAYDTSQFGKLKLR